jgi:two-component sensor histidine kinase
LEKISTKVYFNVFVQNIQKMIENKALVIDYTIEDVVFNVSQCMSIGMIISELVSNSIKYAFVSQENPVITIHLMHTKSDNNIVLQYSDNGIGFDVHNNSKGLGSTLIDVFSKQLHGSYQYSNNNGSSFILQFSI